MAYEPGDAEEEADEEIRADGAVRIHPDAAEKGRHAQCPENEADGSPEEADDAPGHHGSEPGALRPSRSAELEEQVEAVPCEHSGDSQEQRAVGEDPAEVAADEGGED